MSNNLRREERERGCCFFQRRNVNVLCTELRTKFSPCALPILAEDLLHRGIRPADYEIVQRQLRPSATSCYCVDFGASTGDLRPYQATTVCDCFLARVGTELGQAFRTWGTLGSLYIASRCFVAASARAGRAT
jgi:hypothetical protein